MTSEWMVAKAREISMKIANEGGIEYFCCHYASPESYDVHGTPLGDAWDKVSDAIALFSSELELAGGSTDEMDFEYWAAEEDQRVPRYTKGD